MSLRAAVLWRRSNLLAQRDILDREEIASSGYIVLAPGASETLLATLAPDASAGVTSHL